MAVPFVSPRWNRRCRCERPLGFSEPCHWRAQCRWWPCLRREITKMMLASTMRSERSRVTGCVFDTWWTRRAVQSIPWLESAEVWADETERQRMLELAAEARRVHVPDHLASSPHLASSGRLLITSPPPPRLLTTPPHLASPLSPHPSTADARVIQYVSGPWTERSPEIPRPSAPGLESLARVFMCGGRAGSRPLPVTRLFPGIAVSRPKERCALLRPASPPTASTRGWSDSPSESLLRREARRLAGTRLGDPTRFWRCIAFPGSSL